MANKNTTYTVYLDFQEKNVKTTVASIKNAMSSIKTMTPTSMISDPAYKDTVKKLNSLKLLMQGFNKAGVIDFSQALIKKDSTAQLMQLEGRLQAFGISGEEAFNKIYKSQYNFTKQTEQSENWVTRLNHSLTATTRWKISNALLNAFSGKIQEAYYFAKDLDRVLTDIRIVSNQTNSDMLSFAKQANIEAGKLASTTRDYAKASLVFFQQGLDKQSVKDMTEATIIASNITGEAADETSQLLTSISQGYKVVSKDMIGVLDSIAKVGATTASDFEQISIGMSKVASMANVAGVPIESLIAQIATMVSVTQESPESIGTSLKTIYGRMYAFKTDLDGIFEDEDGEIFSAPKVEEAFQSFNIATGASLSLFDKNTGKLKDAGVLINDIGEAWQRTTDKELKFGLSTALAGARQQNRLISLFDNWEQYEESLANAMNASGTAMEQQAKYVDSYAGKMEGLRNAFEGLYDALLDADGMKSFVGFLTTIVKMATKVTTAMGGMSAVIGTSVGLATKAFGQPAFRKLAEVHLKTPSIANPLGTDANAESNSAKLRAFYSEKELKYLEDEFNALKLKNNQIAETNQQLKMQFAYYQKLKNFFIIDPNNPQQISYKSPGKILSEKIVANSSKPIDATKPQEVAQMVDLLEKADFKELLLDIGKIKKEIVEMIPPEALVEFNKFIKMLDEASQASHVLPADLAKIVEQQQKFENLALDKRTKTFLDQNANLEKRVIDSDAELVIAGKSVEVFNEKLGKLGKVVDETNFLANGITTFTTASSHLFSTWNNEGLTTMEKIQQSFGSLGSVIMANSGSLMTSFQKNFSTAIKAAQAGMVETAGAAVTMSAGLAGAKAATIALGTTLWEFVTLNWAFFAAAAGVVALIKIFDVLHVSMEEQDKIVLDLKDSIASLNDELTSLKEIQTPSKGELARIRLLENQIKLNEILLEQEERKKQQKLISGGWGPSALLKSQGAQTIESDEISTGLSYLKEFGDLTSKVGLEAIQLFVDDLRKIETDIMNEELAYQSITDKTITNSPEYKAWGKSIEDRNLALENGYTALNAATGATDKYSRVTKTNTGELLANKTAIGALSEQYKAFEETGASLEGMYKTLSDGNTIALSDLISLAEKYPAYESQILSMNNNKLAGMELTKTLWGIEKQTFIERQQALINEQKTQAGLTETTIEATKARLAEVKAMVSQIEMASEEGTFTGDPKDNPRYLALQKTLKVLEDVERQERYLAILQSASFNTGENSSKEQDPFVAAKDLLDSQYDAGIYKKEEYLSKYHDLILNNLAQFGSRDSNDPMFILLKKELKEWNALVSEYAEENYTELDQLSIEYIEKQNRLDAWRSDTELKAIQRRMSRLEEDRFKDLVSHEFYLEQKKQLEQEYYEASQKLGEEALEKLENSRDEAIKKLETEVYGAKGREAYENAAEVFQNGKQDEIDALETQKEAEDELIKRQEYQVELQQLKIKLANILENKNTQILTRGEDGRWQFQYIADPAQVQDAQEEIKKKQEDFDKWEKDTAIKKRKAELQAEINASKDAVNARKKEFEDKETIIKESYEKTLTETNTFLTNLKNAWIESGGVINSVITSILENIKALGNTKFDGTSVNGEDYSTLLAKFNESKASGQLSNEAISEISSIIKNSSLTAQEKTNGMKYWLTQAKVMDTGGLLKPNATAINLSGRNEQVLNPEQTRAFNFGMAELPALLNRLLRPISNSKINKTHEQKIQQNVKIEASFPNATSAEEIRRALLTLSQGALQYVK